MAELRFSPKTVRVVVSTVSVFPLVLGALLVVYTPRTTFSEPVFWAGLLSWTSVGLVLTQREIASQRPEAEERRNPRRPFLQGHHYLRAGLFVAILLLFLALHGASRAPASTAAAAFLSGISGFLLVQGIGYSYELGLRERLHYCKHCEGHRAFIWYNGRFVCGICGLPWSGEEREWEKPPESPGRRRAGHAFAEFFLTGPFLIVAGIFGLQVLPAVGLADWVAIPLFLMFGGLVTTIALYRHFSRKIQADLHQSRE